MAPTPRCPGLPFIGNAHQLLRDPRALMLDGYRHAGPVFALKAFRQRITVIAGEVAKSFMAEGLDESYLTRHPLFDPLEREFGRGDFTMAHSGHRHTRLRPPLAISFSRQVASPFVGALTDVVRRQAREWPTGARFPVVDAAGRLAFAQWCQLLGPPASRLAYRDCQRLSSFWMLVGAGAAPAWIFRAPWYRSAHRRVFGIFWELVRAARSGAPASGAPATIVDTLLSARDSAGVPLSDDEAVTYLAYGTLGACAYVSRLAAFMLYEIVRDDALQLALRAEAQEAFQSGLHDASGLRRMRLLQSVYHETLRRHVVSPGMPFIAARDFAFRGYRVRRGDTAIVTPVPLSASPAAFPDPERFDAARCREPRNEHRGGHCLPFGLGNRTCVAGGLVEIMTTTLVAAVLDARDLSLDPPGYRLALTVLPLPAPNRRCKLRVGSAPATSTRTPVAAVPIDDERLATFAGHDDPVVLAALARADVRRFAPGAVILREGDAADAYFLLQSGTAVVTRGAPPAPVATLGPGEGFGEIGLLQNIPRSATVTAGAAGAETLVLDRESFLGMVASSDLVAGEIRGLMEKRTAANRLQVVAPGLTASAVAQVLPDFTWVTHAPGDVILREGDPADHFFVLVEGEVDVSRRGADGHDAVIGRLGPGQYFGELGFLHHAPRNATVTAGSAAPVTLLRTDRAGFDRLLNQTGGAGTALAQAMLACANRLAAH